MGVFAKFWSVNACIRIQISLRLEQRRIYMLVPQIGDLLGDSRLLKKHILKLLIIGLILSILAGIFLDQPLAQYFAQDSASDFRLFFRQITDIGLSEYYFVIALLTWAFAAFVAPKLKVFQKVPERVEFARRWGLNFFVALIVSGLLVHIIKFCVGRQRPHKSPIYDPYIFDPITTHWHWHSFASGHSQVMLTAATMMAIALPKFRWFFLSFAVVICFSRVVVLDHFLSDTIMGGTVGYCGALIALRLMKLKTKNGLY